MARSHADAFLEAILQDPDDDTPRLIFADWLEEQGDSRSAAHAEFIRIQCALTGGRLPPQRRAELERRQQQILDEWDKEWVHPIRHLVQTWNYSRGFIDEVAMRADIFLGQADQLFCHAPIQHLHLRPRLLDDSFFLGASIHIAALAENEHLRRLRSLDLHSHHLESRDVRALIVSGYLTNLTVLNLSHNRIGDSGIRALANSPLLGRLERLNLWSNDFGASGLRTLAHTLEVLARSPEGLRLQRLELSHHNLSASGQRVIAESPLLRRLVRA